MPTETVLYTTLRGDDEPIEELPAEIITYGYRLNRPGSIKFALSLDHEKCRRDVIWPGIHEAVVKRNKQVAWRGPVLTAREDEERGMVEFGGEGLFAHCRKMHVTSTIDHTDETGDGAKDLAVIARELIDHHQSKAGGDFGIDTSGSETTRPHEHVYYSWQQKNIYEAIIQLAERNDGFDFEVDHETRRFIAHYPRQGTRQPDLIWEDGIRKFTRDLDATTQASQVLGIGAGEREDTLLRSRQDSTAVAEYGLTQSVYTNKDVNRAQSLDDHVRRELSLMANPAETVGVTIGTDHFNPFSVQMGVEGRLKYDSKYDPVNEFRRLVGFDIVWEEGDERTVLFLQELT